MATKNIAPDNLFEIINSLRSDWENSPGRYAEIPEYKIQQKFINEPGNVGTVWYNPGDPLNQYGFTPSEVDFSNAKLAGTEAQKDAFGNVAGEAALYKTDGGTLVYDPKTSSLNAFRPDAPTSYDPSQIQYNFAGTPYIEPTKTASTYKYNGIDVPITQNDVFAIDPLTGKAYTTPGDYAWTTKTAPSSGGFADWATSNGWMIPLAMMAVAGGAAAVGAEAGAGAGVASAEAGGAAGGTATGTGLTGGAGGSTGILGGGTVGTISAPTSAGALGLNAAAESAIAAGAGAGISTGASSFAPAGVGGLNAALPAAGSVGGAGAMSAALPAGTIIGDGTLGTVLGASYVASAPGQFATDIFGNAIPASSIGIGSTGAAGGYELLSNLGNALKGAQIIKGLLGTGKNPLQAQSIGAQPMQQQQRQYAGVDYSPILNLLALKSPDRSRNSLLG